LVNDVCVHGNHFKARTSSKPTIMTQVKKIEITPGISLTHRNISFSFKKIVL